MNKILLFISLSFFVLNANDTLKQKNILLVKDMIEREEKLAESFEKYILTEFVKPATINAMMVEGYLGADYSITNPFGTSQIIFRDTDKMLLRYALDKDNLDEYLKLVYNTPIYRKNSVVFYDGDTPDNSRVKLKLKSDEAKNILALLVDGETIEKTCPPSAASRYCSVNDNSIRWYNSTSNWIEYSKRYLNKGNITVQNTTMLTDDKLKELPVGTFIYLQNGSKYVKLVDDGGTLNILKVD